MKDFPQELVDQVIDELFFLVGKDNCYQGYKRFRYGPRSAHGISDYSLVSKAWASSTQKHHFSSLRLDCLDTLEKWRTGIAPDPEGVSRHVRKLVLHGFDPPDLEEFEEHLRAFTRVQCLTVKDCYDVLGLPSIMGWFPLMGSCLVELRIDDSPATPHTIASLLAVLPMLQTVQIYNLEAPEDADEAITPTPSRIPFFEGANHFSLCSDYGDSGYPEGSLDWIPLSAQFGRLEIDMACSLHHTDIVNRWLASSCDTLTKLSILGDSDAHIPSEPSALNLLPCTALESLQIPISSSSEVLPPRVNSSQLAKVTLELNGKGGEDTVNVGDRAWETIERRLCPVAKQFTATHPGKKMEVEIAGPVVFRKHSDMVRVLKTLDDKGFLPKLKEEAKVVIPQYNIPE